MKDYFILILLFVSTTLAAQNQDAGVLSSAGQTFQNFPVSAEMNFTFGTAFGKLESAAPCVEVISGVPALSTVSHQGDASSLGLDEIIDCLESFLGTVGIDDDVLDDSTARMYYDASTQQFVLSGLQDELINAQLFIIDLTGKVIAEHSIDNAQSIPARLDNLPQSMFVAAVVSDQRLILTTKFILNQ